MALTALDLLIISVAVGILQFLVSKWLEARLTNSIKHEYDQKLTEIAHDYSRKLEEFKFDVRKREQAAKVAELLAMHHNTPAKGEETKFDQLIWELSLWLPAELVRMLSRHLVGEDDAQDARDLLTAIRKQLHGPSDDLLPSQIVYSYRRRVSDAPIK